MKMMMVIVAAVLQQERIAAAFSRVGCLLLFEVSILARARRTTGGDSSL
jgi:hypothetical protein